MNSVTHILIISKNFSFSYSLSFLYSSTLSMSNLCFVFGLGGSNGHVRIAILASLTTLGIWGCDMSLSTTTPLTNEVSSSEPPTLPSTLMSSKSTSRRERSATERTASTAMEANLSWAMETLRSARSTRRLTSWSQETFWQSSSGCSRRLC
jgi:hypothetical protein